MTLPRVSVIVPAYNAEETIRPLLDSLLSLDYPDYHVIVVNDGSEDNTKAIVQEYPVELIDQPNRGTSAARDAGMKAARDAIVAYVDSDVVVARDWLRHLVEPFEDPEVAATTGHTTFLRNEKCTSWVRSLDIERRFARRREHTRLANGLNSAFRKDVLQEVGGFDPNWHHAEDTEVSYRLRARGYVVKYVPSASVNHVPEGYWLNYLKKRFRDARAYTRTLVRYPKTAILDDDFVSLPMKIQPPLYLLLIGVLVTLPVTFYTPVYESLLYFLLVGHLFAFAFALSEALPVAARSKRLSFGPKAMALGLSRGYVWAAGFIRGLIDTLSIGRQRHIRTSVLQLTSPHSSASVEAELMEFYDRFPCGGDDESDDDRLSRFPWMKEEFGSKKHAGDLVLDVGCGIGKDVENFVEHNATVVGIDIAERPLLHAKNRLEHANSNGRWHLLRADARFLPFKSAVFDHFHSNGVLHHIANYERALREIRRSLKEQGSGTVLVYHKRSLMTMLTVLARSIADQRVPKTSRLGPVRLKESKASESGLAEVFSHPLIQYFPRQTLTRKLQEAGFDTLRLRAYDPFFPVLRRTRRLTPTFLDDLLGRFLVATVQKHASLHPTSQAGD